MSIYKDRYRPEQTTLSMPRTLLSEKEIFKIVEYVQTSATLVFISYALLSSS